MDPKGKHPFFYYAPTEDQVKTMQAVNEKIRAAYEAVNSLIPPSADRTLAIRKLQEARMWANCAIVMADE
jgi:hypothetical protein